MQEKLYQYRDLNTGEVVYEEYAEEYVLDRLGITIIPKGTGGSLTVEQLENIQETIEWFFSGGNWIREESKNSEQMDIFKLINEECGLEYV